MYENVTEQIPLLKSLSGKKILFATMPMEGHFNPLTGLAKHLQEQGYEVSWYTGSIFKDKLQALGIPHHPFKKALEVTQHNLDTLFPERKAIKNSIKRLCFDLTRVFIDRGLEMMADIEALHCSRSFDLIIADSCFSAVPFIEKRIGVPVVSIGAIPLVEGSPDIAPPGIGLTPANTALGKLGYQMLTRFVNKVLLRGPNQTLHRLLEANGISFKSGNILDIIIEKSQLFLQIGTPGFEYKRRHISKHIHFIGPLLPYSKKQPRALKFQDKLKRYKKVVLVTQGTLEPDLSKLIIPTLEAFKNTDCLIIVTTAGNGTAELRAKYPHDNLVIEDYIPFSDVMTHADVYVSNGGYGGVLLSVMNGLPMVVGGVHEGKNEVCARVGYFGLGINLKTETPKAKDIRAAVEKVMANEGYKKAVGRLAAEFNQYKPEQQCASFVKSLLPVRRAEHLN